MALRGRELAIRAALGASPARAAGHVLGERLRVAPWGVFGGAMLTAFAVAVLVEATNLRGPHPGVYPTVGLTLVAAALLASGRALSAARSVAPATVLD